MAMVQKGFRYGDTVKAGSDSSNMRRQSALKNRKRESHLRGNRRE